MRFAVASRRDFGRRDYCFPARILVRFAAGSRRDLAAGIFSSWRESRRDSRQDPGEILAAGIFTSRRDFGRREFRFPARILPGSRDSRRGEKSRRPKSRRDPDGIPATIAAGSRQDPGSYFTRVTGSLHVVAISYTRWLHTCLLNSIIYICTQGFICYINVFINVYLFSTGPTM